MLVAKGGACDAQRLPAPVIGGLIVAALVTALRGRGVTLLQLDTTLQTPLMIAFFTSVGFGASVALLRTGGPAVALFLAASTVVAVALNVIGPAWPRRSGKTL